MGVPNFLRCQISCDTGSTILKISTKHNEMHCNQKSVYVPFINMRWPRPPNQKRTMAAERMNENSSIHFDQKEAKD